MPKAPGHQTMALGVLSVCTGAMEGSRTVIEHEHEIL